MTGARHAGPLLALGVLALAVAGCAATVQPGDPASVITTSDTAPPVTACPDRLPSTLRTVPGTGLVPGTPIAALACRYYGLNDRRPGALAQSAQVTGAVLATLVADVRGEQPWPPGQYGCPVDLGLADLIVFTYPSGAQAEVRVDTGGCALATNGHQQFKADSVLLDELTSLVGASPPPST